MSTADNFVSGKASIDDALLGLVLQNPGLVLLKNSRIVIRRDHQELTNVKILAGGGGGHEPAHAGFIGKGMLTAAVTGDLFAAPPTVEILRAIRELGLNHKPGVLLIINNYTGDRLNFGLAMDRARAENIKIEMITVDEDCAIDDYSKTTGCRGLAGTILIQKIAGAMADKGMSLAEIKHGLNKYKMLLKTIGITIDTSKTELNINKTVVELGKGIHGEPGVNKIEVDTMEELIKIMLNKILKSFDVKNLEVIILINNLGGCSKLNELAFTKETIKQLNSRDIKVLRVFSGVHLSSLNALGYSITILKSNNDILKSIDYNCNAPAWSNTLTFKNCVETNMENVFLEDSFNIDTSKKEQLFGPRVSDLGAETIEHVLSTVCEALVSCEKQLNIIDAETGDGDTGSTLAAGAQTIKNALHNGHICTERPGSVLKKLSFILEKAMGGTSGALYSIFFEAGSSVFRNLPDDYDVNFEIWLNALQVGNKAIMTYGLAEPGDRTMLDALNGAQLALEESIKNGLQCKITAINYIASAAETSAQETVEMPAKAGRASYAQNTVKKMPDPGAHAVGIWFRAMCEALKTSWQKCESNK